MGECRLPDIDFFQQHTGTFLAALQKFQGHKPRLIAESFEHFGIF
jgi:hypothetical protein